MTETATHAWLSDSSRCTSSSRRAEKLTDDKWDYMIGGAETETTLKRNRMALDSLGFRPRVLLMYQASTARHLFGKSCACP